MSLYSLNGQEPSALPFRITLPNGQTRTDPSTFKAAEITAAGYVKAPAQPAFDPATHQLAWSNGNWTVEALPPPPGPEAYTLTRRQLRAAVALSGISRDAIPNAIEQIADPVQRDLALTDLGRRAVLQARSSALCRCAEHRRSWPHA